MPPRSTFVRLAALLVLLPSLGGCVYVGGAVAGGALLGATLGAASTPRPLPVTARYPAGAAVLIDFSPPRDLTASRRGERDSLRVATVTRLVGQLRETRGDTLWIAVAQLRRTGGGPLSFAHGHEPMTAIPPEGLARVHVIASNGQLVHRVLTGALIGAAVIVLLVITICAQDACYYYD